MEVLRVTDESIAKMAEKYIYDAIKPGGFEESIIPIPQLKDVLAWRTWANLKRPEQPTFVAIESNEIVGIALGEPIETWFDEGESEIQDIIISPKYNSEDLFTELFKSLFNYYQENSAKQVHVWCLEDDYISGDLNLKSRIAVEKFAFEFNGMKRVSKWSGKKIIKLEHYL